MNQTYPKMTLLIALSLVVVAALACGGTKTDEPVSNAPVSDPGTANTATTPATDARDVSGDYTITGTNEGGGGEYGGALKITKRDKVYQFSWASGTRTYDGVGVQTGDTLGVAFSEGNDGTGCGVVLYKIGADGSLDGKAGYWGVNQSETETAKRTKGTDLEGDYDVSGTNTGSTKYNGTLSVKKAGAGYNFAWDTGKPLKGFGIRSGSSVVVGFGTGDCGFVGYHVENDGSLSGQWGSPGSTSIGTEIAKKK